MTFEQRAKKIDDSKAAGIPFKSWSVHFEEKYDHYVSDPIFYCTANVLTIYDDWYNECTYCPENETYVWNVMFSDENGCVYLIDTTTTNYQLDFQTLMFFVADHID